MARPRSDSAKRRIISIRVDDSMYKWLIEKQKMMNLDDLSTTVREILKSARFMIESGSVVLPDEDVIDDFIEFLSNLKKMNNHK